MFLQTCSNNNLIQYYNLYPQVVTQGHKVWSCRFPDHVWSARGSWQRCVWHRWLWYFVSAVTGHLRAGRLPLLVGSSNYHGRCWGLGRTTLLRQQLGIMRSHTYSGLSLFVLLLCQPPTTQHQAFIAIVCLPDSGRRSCPDEAGLWQRHIGWSSTANLLNRLQSVINAAARSIACLRRSEHITDTVASFHWLHAPERVKFKLANLVYRALNGTAHRYRYLSEHLIRAMLFVALFITDASNWTFPVMFCWMRQTRHPAVIHFVWTPAVFWYFGISGLQWRASVCEEQRPITQRILTFWQYFSVNCTLWHV